MWVSGRSVGVAEWERCGCGRVGVLGGVSTMGVGAGLCEV